MRDARLASVAFSLSLVGFYTFAPLLPDGSNTISILLRAIFLATSLACFFVLKPVITQRSMFAITPMILLLLAYALRVIDNYYLQMIPAYIGFGQLMSFLLGSSLFAAFCAFAFAVRINERHLNSILNMMSLVFLLGLMLNYDALFADQIDFTRASLARVNAISLTNTSLTFLLYFILFHNVSPKTRLIAYGAGPIMLMAISFSQSRGPIVAMGLSLLVYVLLRPQKNAGLLVRISLGLIAATFILQFVLGINVLSGVLQRFDLSLSQNTSSVLVRQVQWNQAWQQFLDDPFFGRYIIEATFNYYPHNIFLEALMSLGLVGGGLLIAHIVIITLASRKLQFAAPSPRIATFATLIMWKELFLGFSSGNIWGSSALWLCSAMVIGAAYSPRPRAHYSIAG